MTRCQHKNLHIFCFQELFPLTVSSPHLKSCFSKPKKELPTVALFWQEKLTFFIPGFPLKSGLVKQLLQFQYCFNKSSYAYFQLFKSKFYTFFCQKHNI